MYDIKQSAHIQIQPQYQSGTQWMDIAKREGLSFEILEFSTAYLKEKVPASVLKWYQNSGCSRSVHGAFMDNYPLSPDPEIRTLSRRRCEESCRYAEAVGAEHVVFHSTALPFVRGGLEKFWACDAAGYYESLAATFGVHIWIENFNDVDPVPMQLMMQQLTDTGVGVCLDVGHANYSRVPLKEWLECLGDSIGYLHLSDNHGNWDEHLPLGEGNVDFSQIDAWWRAQERTIPVTLEVKTIPQLEKSLLYLKENQLFGF